MASSRLGRDRFARHLGARGYQVIAESAGIHGGELGVHEHTVRAASDLQVDLGGHTSRLVTAQPVTAEGADLVITMTRQHLRHVIELAPEAWPRASTLKELARRSINLTFYLADFASWRTAGADGRRSADLM